MNGRFPFLGNQLALDFLNTEVVLGGKLKELLPHALDLAAWMNEAGLLDNVSALELRTNWADRNSHSSMRRLWQFRKELRDVVLNLEAGRPVPASFLSRLNDLLASHPGVVEVVKVQQRLERRPRFEPSKPEDVFAPLADAVAELLTIAPQDRIRKCQGCVAHFLDTSKKGTRLWCSPALCGNRAKVAAFAARRRAEASNR